MDQQQRARLVRAVAGAVIAAADHLTALDQAIGDGDHGVNMKRGCEAVLGDLDAITAKPLPDMLKAIGMALVMKVGGASGPLYGTLFLELGKALPGAPARGDVACAFASAIRGVMARGKSEPGQKTMLDVLVPTAAALAGGADGAALKAAAGDAAAATVPMQAIRGRASFLGPRSVGHMDPGAASSALMIKALVDALETPP
ncbi:MAG: dihydroxyacetone kinase subunit L [Acetobacteraceae bacterium]|nr:dihydroxyacetone kinase subunit L [Acetobacteraceae bacterium]